MTDRLVLDRLHAMLGKAGVSDSDLIAGVELTHAGYQKIAGQFHVSVKEANFMVSQLITSLRMEERRISENYYRALSEANERYAFEKDFLKNVTIRDTRSGETKFVSGSEANELLSALANSPQAEQEILANYMAGDSELTEEDVEEDADDSYAAEIDSKVGSYNFPWKDGEDQGTATVTYSGDANIRLISIRDEQGDEVQVDKQRNELILRQAFAFIGDA